MFEFLIADLMLSLHSAQLDLIFYGKQFLRLQQIEICFQYFFSTPKLRMKNTMSFLRTNQKLGALPDSQFQWDVFTLPLLALLLFGSS